MQIDEKDPDRMAGEEVAVVFVDGVAEAIEVAVLVVVVLIESGLAKY